MKQNKVLDILLLCLKIILPALLLIPLAFFTYRLVECRMDDIANAGVEGYHSGMGLYIFASYVLLIAANAVLSLVGGVGLWIAKRYTATPNHSKIFLCLTLAPMASQVLYTAMIIAVMNIG